MRPHSFLRVKGQLMFGVVGWGLENDVILFSGIATNILPVLQYQWSSYGQTPSSQAWLHLLAHHKLDW